MNIKKKTKGPYWNYLNKDKKKHHYIHVDWNLYIDEDEEDQKPNDMGFPGMGGMGGNFMDMGMPHNMPDEDDEVPVDDDQENKEDNKEDNNRQQTIKWL